MCLGWIRLLELRQHNKVQHCKFTLKAALSIPKGTEQGCIWYLIAAHFLVYINRVKVSGAALLSNRGQEQKQMEVQRASRLLYMLTTGRARFRNSTLGLSITASFPCISSIFSCLRTFCHISKTLIHPSQGGVPSSQRQGLNVKTEQRCFSCLSPRINQIKLSALRMSQNDIIRARNPPRTTSSTTGQHVDTHFSSQNFFFHSVLL